MSGIEHDGLDAMRVPALPHGGAHEHKDRYG